MWEGNKQKMSNQKVTVQRELMGKNADYVQGENELGSISQVLQIMDYGALE